MSAASTLGNRLRDAIAQRDLLAARLGDTRARLVSVIASSAALAAKANEAQLTLRDLLGADAPQPDATARAKCERDECAEAAADQALAGDALRSKVDDLESKHSDAIHAAAQAAEAVAVHIGLERRERLREAFVTLAQRAREFHAACYAADKANRIATGSPGEPILHASYAASRLMSSPDGRDGIVGILNALGIQENLVPMSGRIPALTEQELLSLAVDDEASSTTAQPTAEQVAAE